MGRSRTTRSVALVAVTACLSAPVLAQTRDDAIILINGTVPAGCRAGEVLGGDDTFDMGVLIDTSTGLLRPDLNAVDKVVVGSFCNTQSTLTVSAIPMSAEDVQSLGSDAFTRRIDFVATASGWTDVPARFETALGETQAAAAQIQPNPTDVDLILSLSNFTPNGGMDRRPVASDDYVGQVTLTLTPSF